MLESKWFEQTNSIYPDSFTSKRVSVTEAEGWEKTIEKWILIEFENMIEFGKRQTCGLCDIAKAKRGDKYPKEDILSIRESICNFCPVMRILGRGTCIVAEYDIEQIFHLLMMREAWRVGGL